jgi:A/G-specific adenine glycosylase
MLQQTQVQTVIPYYQRFLRRFPTLKRLAQARNDELLHLWAGLGYYSRVRNLQQTARIILKQHQGQFPRSYAEVIALPGIGRYTAGAILSIAFNQPYPVLDGNVARVLSRLGLIRGKIKESRIQRQLWDLAKWLLHPDAPGDFNQAVMELGATVCTTRLPRCEQCPWSGVCLAHAAGLQHALPDKPNKRAPRAVESAVAVIYHRGAFLLIKRTGQKLLRDFWEFPGAPLLGPKDAEAVLIQKVRNDLGIDITLVRVLGCVKQGISTQRITLRAFLARPNTCAIRTGASSTVKWVLLSKLNGQPMAAAARKIAILARDQLKLASSV